MREKLWPDGPWEWEGRHLISRTNWPDTYGVLPLEEFDYEPREQEAIRRLIAAAPELVELLGSESLNELLGYIEDCGNEAIWAHAKLFMERRDEALAKAYGDSDV